MKDSVLETGGYKDMLRTAPSRVYNVMTTQHIDGRSGRCGHLLLGAMCTPARTPPRSMLRQQCSPRMGEEGQAGV